MSTVLDIAKARRNQYAAFVRDEGVLIVWDDTVERVIPAARRLEQQLLDLLWCDEKNDIQASPSGILTYSMPNLHYTVRPSLPELASTPRLQTAAPQMDLEANKDGEKSERPTMKITAVVSGLSVALTIMLMGLLLREFIGRISLPHLRQDLYLYVTCTRAI